MSIHAVAAATMAVSDPQFQSITELLSNIAYLGGCMGGLWAILMVKRLKASEGRLALSAAVAYAVASGALLALPTFLPTGDDAWIRELREGPALPTSGAQGLAQESVERLGVDAEAADADLRALLETLDGFALLGAGAWILALRAVKKDQDAQPARMDLTIARSADLAEHSKRSAKV